MAFSPDGTRLAVVGANGLVDAWDVRTGREVWGAARRTGPVNLTGVAGARTAGTWPWRTSSGSTSWMPRPVSSSRPSTGRSVPGAWRTGRTAGAWPPPASTRRCASGTSTTGRCRPCGGTRRASASVAYRFDGRYLASAGEDGLVIVWDATDPDRIKEARRIPAHRDVINSVAFSPDGRRLATGSGDGTVKIWDADTGALRRLIRARQQGVNAVAYHPEGKLLASAGADGTVKIWEVPASPELPDPGEVTNDYEKQGGR